MAENDNLPQEQQKDTTTDSRYMKNLTPAAKKKVMERAKAIDKLLEDEDVDDDE